MSVKLGVYVGCRSVADVPLGALAAAEEELGPGAARMLDDEAAFDAVAAEAEAEAEAAGGRN